VKRHDFVRELVDEGCYLRRPGKSKKKKKAIKEAELPQSVSAIRI